MPSPHGQNLADQTKRVLLRYSTEEDAFIRRRAAEWQTSINATIRRIIREAMTPADPRAAAIAAIEQHWARCLAGCVSEKPPQCAEGTRLKAAYDATLGAPTAPPARKTAPTGRRPLKGAADGPERPRRKTAPDLPPVEPVPGQASFLALPFGLPTPPAHPEPKENQ